MALSEDRKRVVLSAKHGGYLKPEFLKMTDEEFLNFIEKRNEARDRERDGTLSPGKAEETRNG